MARTAKAKRKAVTLPSNDGVILEQLVTPEARRHGDYRIATVSITEGEHGPNQKGEQSAVINYGGSTVDRWVGNGSLDQRQYDAIRTYRRAHAMTFGSGSIGMNWDRFLSGVSTGRYDAIAPETEAEARSDLAAMDKLWKRMPPYVAETWVNVVLYDMPAGVAGDCLSHGTEKAARAGALTIVRLCCDLIAGEWGL